MIRSLLYAGVLGLAAAKDIKINGMEHDIQLITKQSFNQVISMNRGDGVAAIWFYYPSSSVDSAFLSDYNKVAQELKGMVKVTAVDATSQPALVKDHPDVKPGQDKPLLVVYGPMHQPPYVYAGKMEKDKVKTHLAKKIPDSYVKTFKDKAEYTKWLAADPEKPKCILFSDKPAGKNGPPTVVKALSTDSVFRRAMKFAFAPQGSPVFDAEKAAASKRDKNKLPAWVVIKDVATGKKKEEKKEWYKGDAADMTFSNLHDWLNVHSESGMGDMVRSGGAGDHGSCEADGTCAEAERLPQFTAASSKTLCFGQKSMCAIYLSKGPIEEPAIDSVLAFDDKFGDTGDRGVKYNWMWADVDVQTEMKKTIEEMEVKAAEKEERAVEPVHYPTMIFVKPPKKKREEKLLSYVRLPNGVKIDEASVGAVIEQIAGGTTYTRATLPGLKTPPKPEKKKKEEL